MARLPVCVFVLALIAHIYTASAVCNGRVAPDRYAGELVPSDSVVQLGSNGFVRMSPLPLGAPYMTFEIDVYTTSAKASGCLFSFANATTAPTNYLEARLTAGAVSFRAGSVTHSTASIFAANQWHHVAFVVSNNIHQVAIWVDGVQFSSGAIGNIPILARDGYIGFCSSARDFFPSGSVDNFVVTNKLKVLSDLITRQRQFFPFEAVNELVAYYPFNEATSATPLSVTAFTGTGAAAFTTGTIVTPASRRLKSDVGGIGLNDFLVTDKYCSFSGRASVDPKTGASQMPFFGKGGGFTQTYECDPSILNVNGKTTEHAFTFNQKWANEGGITEMMVMSSNEHRFRISPGNPLRVEHMEWGGWSQLGLSNGVIREDQSSYAISIDEFHLQSAGYGWIRIRMASDRLSYDFAVVSSTCGNNVTRTVGKAVSPGNFCAWTGIDQTHYQMDHIPTPEPMGPTAVTVKGLAGLPDTLACPTIGPYYRQDIWCTYFGEGNFPPLCCNYYPYVSVICYDYNQAGYCYYAGGDARCCPSYPSRAVCFGTIPTVYCQYHPEDTRCCNYIPSRDVCFYVTPTTYCLSFDTPRCCSYYPSRESCFAVTPGPYCSTHLDQVRCCPYFPAREMCFDVDPVSYCSTSTQFGNVKCCNLYPEREQCYAVNPVSYCERHPEEAQATRCCQFFPARDVCFAVIPAQYCGFHDQPRCCPYFPARESCFAVNPVAYCAFYPEQLRCCQYYPTRPFCIAQQGPAPPQPPLFTTFDPPFIAGDPCVKVTNDDPLRYSLLQAGCGQIWDGKTAATGYKACLAEGCLGGDSIAPLPDCRTENMKFAADPTYIQPSRCTTGCPNACSFNGVCNATSHVCTCTALYTGNDCSQFKKYSCWTVGQGTGADVRVNPIQMWYKQDYGTPLLTPSFNSYATSNYNGPFMQKLQDTVMVFPAFTLDAWDTRTRTYHIWVTNNNGNGVHGGYTMTLNWPGGTVLTAVEPQAVRNGVSFVVAANVITVTVAWADNDWNGFVLRKIPSPSNMVVKVTPNIGAGGVQQVVVMGAADTGTQSSFEVVRIDPSFYAAGFRLKGDTCTNTCNYASCSACAADPACGWCVETEECMVGIDNGPSDGVCLNWRKTFNNTISRRLTQIPSFPANPGFTDVYLSSVQATELPIQLSVSVSRVGTTQWDVLFLTQFDSAASAAWRRDLATILSSMGDSYPNVGVALAALSTVQSEGFNFIRGVTNPRDGPGFTQVVKGCGNGCATAGTGDVRVIEALWKIAEPGTNAFGFRSGTRKVVIIVSNRPFVANSSAIAQLKTRLLQAQLVPVFAVPSSLVASYSALVDPVTGFGFGAVANIAADFSNLASLHSQALSRAASTVSATVDFSDPSLFGHIDQAAYNARSQSMTITNLETAYRARFWLPVKRQAVLDRTSVVYVAGYSTAKIESVPSDAPSATSPYIIKGKELNNMVIQLPGRTFRNMFRTTAKITIFPPTLKGDFYRAIDGVDGTGAPTVTAGDWIDPAGPDALKVVTNNKLVYIPPNTGSTFGVDFTRFTYIVIDGCTQSVPFEVQIDLDSINLAPVAEMIGVIGSENTPLVISLGLYDPNPTDVLEAYIDSLMFDSSNNPSNRSAGDLYQYVDNFDPKTGVKILTNGTKVTDASFRVIYVPPRYGSSFANPVTIPELQIIPCFSYYAKEFTNSGGVKLRSPSVQVPVVLLHVNHAPWVWGDTDSYRPFAPVAPGVCWGGVNAPTCVFDEDFGEEFWWNTGFRFIQLGGDDVEKSVLTFKITGLDCLPSAEIYGPLDSANSVEVGDVIYTHASGSMLNTLRFRPGKETTTASFGKAYYCQIDYVVIDDEGAPSATTGRVTIDVKPVNKQPRFDNEGVQQFIVQELTPYQFVIPVADPEGSAFTSTIVKCSNNKGKLQFCLNDLCSSLSPVINCNDAKSGPITVPKTSGTEHLIGQYISDVLSTPIEGLNYKAVTFRFADSGSSFPQRDFVVQFDVIKINTAPVMSYNDFVGPSFDSTQLRGQSWTGRFNVIDKDAGLGQMTLTVSLDNSKAAGAAFDPKSLSAPASGFVGEILDTSFTFVGTLDQVNSLLAAVTIKAPLIPVNNVPQFATLTLIINDNGYTGQCPDSDEFSTSLCPLTNGTRIAIVWTLASDNTGIVAGSAGSAAGFAAVAAIAAAALFRRMNRKAEEAYEPWNVENDDVLINSPLYQESGASGTNALYESSNNRL